MNQLTQYLEAYELILYSGGVTIALICAWVSNSKLRYKLWQAHQVEHNQDKRIESYKKEIKDLKSLLRTQEVLIKEMIK